MHPDVKIKLKKEIEVFMEKNPESNVSDLRRFLKLGSTGDLIAQFKKSSFSMFLKRNYEKFKETARRIYPAGNAIFQDDGATIHRCPAALAAVNDCFRYRVDPALQAPKMADFWPIENVWGILKQKISQKESKNLKQLRTNIVTAWREINADKDLCRQMMVSLPKRAAAIVRKNGSQITKNDY